MPSTSRSDTVEAALRTLETRIARARTCDAALELATYYGLFAAANFSLTYDGGRLEDQFIGKFGADFACAITDELPQKEAIHVISSSYKTGGHTRLMERLAAMHDVPPDLVVTEKSNVDYADAAYFSLIHDVSNSPHRERLRQLVALLCRYQKIVLHIHPHDFIAAVAVKIVRAHVGRWACFVNHADHLFSFGRQSVDVVLQVSAFGELLGRTRLPTLTTSFLGIPLQASWESIDFSQHHDQSIFTAGAHWKYRPRAGLSLPVLLNALLRLAPQARVDALGVRPWLDWWWWALKIRHPQRVKLLRALPFSEYIQQLKNYSFVLDSFPITGGTAFPESIIQGRVAMGVQGPMTGYTPADELRAAGIEELGEILRNPAGYVVRLRRMLPRMKEVHGYNEVRTRYLDALAGTYSANPLLAGFRGDPFFFQKKYLQTINLPTLGFDRSAVVFRAETFIFLRYLRQLSILSIVKYGLAVTRLTLKAVLCRLR